MIEYTDRLFKFNETEEINTEIMGIFHKTTELHEKFPEVLFAIEADLDKHSLKKKQLRIETKRYNDKSRCTSGELFSFYEPGGNADVMMRLETGRPRMQAEIVLFFMALRDGSILERGK